MMVTKYKPVIILSAYLGGNTEKTNYHRHQYLEAELEHMGLQVHEVQGCYKGNKELAFMVLPKDNKQMHKLINLAHDKFSQESVLCQDNEGISWLMYADKDVKLGKMRATPKELAVKQDNYTEFNGKYYTVGA